MHTADAHSSRDVEDPGAYYETKNELKDKAKIIQLAKQARGDEPGDEKASGCFSRWMK